MVSSTEQPAEVAAYLRQLDAALIGMPTTIAADIRQGIAEELAALDAQAAQERIGQLGDPAFIAAEARAAMDTTAPRTGLRSRWYIVLAALMIAIGGYVIPVAGWIGGCVLVCISPVWRRWEKVVAVVTPIGIGGLVAGYFMISELVARAAATMPSDQPLLPINAVVIWNAAVAAALANIAVGIWLAIRALRRT